MRSGPLIHAYLREISSLQCWGDQVEYLYVSCVIRELYSGYGVDNAPKFKALYASKVPAISGVSYGIGMVYVLAAG